MWQRENQMPMGSIDEQVLFAIKPAFNLNLAALWAVAVFTGIIMNTLDMPVGTGPGCVRP